MPAFTGQVQVGVLWARHPLLPIIHAPFWLPSQLQRNAGMSESHHSSEQTCSALALACAPAASTPCSVKITHCDSFPACAGQTAGRLLEPTNAEHNTATLSMH